MASRVSGRRRMRDAERPRTRGRNLLQRVELSHGAMVTVRGATHIGRSLMSDTRVFRRSRRVFTCADPCSARFPPCFRWGAHVSDDGKSGAIEEHVAGNLPAALTRLGGRRRELAELSALVGATRLLTLTGPGGSGKSRLGLALAEARRDEYPGGAWWIDLTTLADPDLIAQHVAATLELSQMPAEGAVDAIVRRLCREPTLLVLDNCEHVADEVAELVAVLLGACRALQLVATSRQPLGVPGEQLFRVGGLAITTPGEPGAEPGAVELFFERAARASAALTVTERTSAAATRVCRWLDGMPLAIELAAARVAVLGVEEIAERLEHDSRLLGQAGRSTPAHHQTMHATLEWSHRMLSPAEQALFRRLAVFRGRSRSRPSKPWARWTTPSAQ